MTYAAAGVNYAEIDPAKVLAQQLAPQTVSGPDWLGVHGQEHFRGESAYVLQLPMGDHIAHVEEGLGTKVLMADLYYQLTGNTGGYYAVGMDTVAMIVNDMATLGVHPVSLQMHLAVGSGEWLKDADRVKALYEGWLEGAKQSSAIWSGGETPVLKGIVTADSAVIAGSAVGYLPTPYLPVKENIQPGDLIIALASSGLHANGVTLVRSIAEGQPDEGLELCQKALVGTTVYVNAVNAVIRAGIVPHYMIHITGHGWRKIMRARAPFTYVINDLLPIPAIFKDIRDLGSIGREEMWGNYNMGAGFAFIVSPEDEDDIVDLCTAVGYTAQVVGRVEKGPKRVIIHPADVTFDDASMTLR